MAHAARHFWLAIAFATASALAQLQQQAAAPAQQWSFPEPLRVCFVSLVEFSVRCNGSPDPALEQPEYPAGIVPRGGWCQGTGEDFCGYDVEVWREISQRLGLVEGRDYERVCMGEDGFGAVVDDLAERNPDNPAETTQAQYCDISAQTITVTLERQRTKGIKFSRPTYRGALAVLIHAPIKRRGMWAFTKPLEDSVWMMVLITVPVVPFIVVFFEAVFSGRCIYADDDGRFRPLPALYEALWHSVSHVLSINVFTVHAFPSRVVVAAYAFLVLIVSNTYTANLAAFLTVDQLETEINTVADLWGRNVATFPTYYRRLEQNHRILGDTSDKWDYQTQIARLRNGTLAAVIADDTILVPEANTAPDCALHVLNDLIEPYDLALGFRRTFDNDAFRDAVDLELLRLLESGRLAELSQQYLRTNSTCSTVTSEYEDTNQVGLQALWGLWVFLAAAILGAAVAAGGQYGFQRLTLCAADPADGPAEDEIKARAEVMVRTISRAITERSRSHRRTASSTGGGGDGDSVEGGSAMSFSASVTRANSMSHSHALSGAAPDRPLYVPPGMTQPLYCNSGVAATPRGKPATVAPSRSANWPRLIADQRSVGSNDLPQDDAAAEQRLRTLGSFGDAMSERRLRALGSFGEGSAAERRLRALGSFGEGAAAERRLRALGSFGAAGSSASCSLLEQPAPEDAGGGAAARAASCSAPECILSAPRPDSGGASASRPAGSRLGPFARLFARGGARDAAAAPPLPRARSPAHQPPAAPTPSAGSDAAPSRRHLWAPPADGGALRAAACSLSRTAAGAPPAAAAAPTLCGASIDELQDLKRMLRCLAARLQRLQEVADQRSDDGAGDQGADDLTLAMPPPLPARNSG